MKLLVIRHGAAMDREEFAETGESDDRRPLTHDGEKEMKRVAAGLKREVEDLDALATSPFIRARQTAQIVGREYGIEEPDITDLLKPDGSFAEFEKWAALYEGDKVVGIVGHEPHLSTLVAWLLSGDRDSSVRLKKGGACLLGFEGRLEREAGTLNWLLTPRQLARFAK